MDNSKNTSGVADELIKFKELLDSGVITQGEFDKKKTMLLNSTNTPVNTSPVTHISQSAGAENKPPRKSKKKGCLISFIIVIGIFSVAMVGISKEMNEITKGLEPSINANNSSSHSEKADEKIPNLELLEHESISENGLSYIVGKIKNNTDKNYSYVQVSINLYNGDSVVGSTLANINNLEPGATWEFKAINTASNCTTYKITDLTGF